jgi:hypothetical protein
MSTFTPKPVEFKFGEYINKGFELFKKDMGTFILAFIFAGILSIIPFFIFLAFGNFIKILPEFEFYRFWCKCAHSFNSFRCVFNLLSYIV